LTKIIADRGVEPETTAETDGHPALPPPLTTWNVVDAVFAGTVTDDGTFTIDVLLLSRATVVGVVDRLMATVPVADEPPEMSPGVTLSDETEGAPNASDATTRPAIRQEPPGCVRPPSVRGMLSSGRSVGARRLLSE
jgi:hypothetical protein